MCDAERNYGGYCNPELDRMIDRQSIEADLEKRRELVWQIEKKLVEDSVRAAIFYPRAAICAQTRVKGLTQMVNSIYNGSRFEDVWLEQGVGSSAAAMTGGPPVFRQKTKRAARETRGLNQGELAARAGLQPSAISHFETGTRKSSFDNLQRLADALDATTHYLLGRVNDLTRLGGGADNLHRHYGRLTSGDREVADRMIEFLAEKAQTQRKA